LAARARLVAVLFADRAPDLSLLPLLAGAGFSGAMLDTAGKTAGRLLDRMDVTALRHFVAACSAHRLLSGLAGSLEAPDIPRLLLLRPGLLGFRRALCGVNGRTGRIDPQAVQDIRALIPLEESAENGAEVDHHLLSAHGYVPDLTGDPALMDRVFVHDLVLPVHVGAYAYEHAAPQRVRFDVDVLIARAPRPTHDMRDVFSYDLISDGIRLLTDAGHVALIETLAERIAAMLLSHPRVFKVRVQLEKLDAGPRVVGVAIERTREQAAPHAGFGFAQ
jgi:dihydroneopterin aldolase